MPDPSPRSESVKARAWRLLWHRPRSLTEAIWVRIVFALVIFPVVAAIYGMTEHGLVLGALWAAGQLLVGIPVDAVRMRNRTT